MTEAFPFPCGKETRVACFALLIFIFFYKLIIKEKLFYSNMHMQLACKIRDNFFYRSINHDTILF